MLARNELGLTARLHDLRHMHASLLIAAGVDVRTVAGRLGHASTQMTTDVYGAFMPEADRRAADMIGDVIHRKA
jgi:integrase